MHWQHVARASDHPGRPCEQVEKKSACRRSCKDCDWLLRWPALRRSPCFYQSVPKCRLTIRKSRSAQSENRRCSPVWKRKTIQRVSLPCKSGLKDASSLRMIFRDQNDISYTSRASCPRSKKYEIRAPLHTDTKSIPKSNNAPKTGRCDLAGLLTDVPGASYAA